MNTTIVTTPIGDLGIFTDAQGVVLAAGWEPLELLAARVLPHLDMSGIVAVDDVPGVNDAMQRYLAGDVAALHDVRVHQRGGPFTQRAWRGLRAIAPGTVATYTELAAASGNPAAVRAAGSACATNGIAPFVPCHRVVRSDGSLGGYRFGLVAKRWLIQHERAHAGPGPR